jgi:hypothetical protein
MNENNALQVFESTVPMKILGSLNEEANEYFRILLDSVGYIGHLIFLRE